VHQQILELRRKVLGPEYPDILQSMNNLITILYARGKDLDTDRQLPNAQRHLRDDSTAPTPQVVPSLICPAQPGQLLWGSCQSGAGQVTPSPSHTARLIQLHSRRNRTQ